MANASIQGGGVIRHWLELLHDLFHSGLLNQAELRILRAVLKAFSQKTVNGGKPKIKGMLTNEHVIALNKLSDKLDHPVYSNALTSAANETADKLK